MIEDFLANLEQPKSILIIDSFEKDGHGLFYTFLGHLQQKVSQSVRFYPTGKKGERLFNQHFASDQSSTVSRSLIENLFLDDKCCIDAISADLESIKSSDSEATRINLAVDNLNLVLRHYQNSPFRVMKFMIESGRKNDLGTVMMLAHQNESNSTLLNQLGTVFQTVIRVDDTKLTPTEMTQFAKLKRGHVFKYLVKVDNRSLKKNKVYSTTETVFIDDEFQVLKVEKHVKSTAKPKQPDSSADTPEELLKGLTFNVHSNALDLEAKKGLILPYEIIGKTEKSRPVEKETESKIYYAPDDRDDFDDEDPDEDLNF